jgi:hypothetical protein
MDILVLRDIEYVGTATDYGLNGRSSIPGKD